MLQDPFHEGERLVQRRAGATAEADRNSPMIASRIPAGALSFVHTQSLLVLALLHEDAVWCLPMVGRPGWMSATRETLDLRLDQLLAEADPRILSAAEHRRRVGGVVLDFATRRRLRINGRLQQRSPTHLQIEVAEAYPNCPKYITRRELQWAAAPAASPFESGEHLTHDQQDAFRKTDIFFIASQHPEGGMDASHRGGNAGFVESPTPNTIKFLDFAGNSLFNTLGNLELDARVGILLPQFEHARALALTGKAWTEYADNGESRTVNVTLERWMQVPFPARVLESEMSPYNPSS